MNVLGAILIPLVSGYLKPIQQLVVEVIPHAYKTAPPGAPPVQPIVAQEVQRFNYDFNDYYRPLQDERKPSIKSVTGGVGVKSTSQALLPVILQNNINSLPSTTSDPGRYEAVNYRPLNHRRPPAHLVPNLKQQRIVRHPQPTLRSNVQSHSPSNIQEVEPPNRIEPPPRVEQRRPKPQTLQQHHARILQYIPPVTETGFEPSTVYQRPEPNNVYGLRSVDEAPRYPQFVDYSRFPAPTAQQQQNHDQQFPRHIFFPT